MKKPLILASGSPRRRELLNLIGIKFKVFLPTFREFTEAEIKNPSTLVKKNAIGKALKAAKLFPTSTVLGVDTVVGINNCILGKPKNRSDAIRMLKLLQGKTHTVYTATSFVRACPASAVAHKIETFLDKSKVEFHKMTDSEIRAYVKTGEPMDKAGAYAIQGIGSRYIKRISGDFFSVMGLPVSRVWSKSGNI